MIIGIADRLRCGYACLQTVRIEILLWIEKKTEDDHSARIRRDALGLFVAKISRKNAKHLFCLVLTLWTGFRLTWSIDNVKKCFDDHLD